ncbi:MAG: hypothetical protein R3321_00045 [Nitrososphaeraceae archaeon]|nr:hypothetical protein [Nitrososphaeraceae archaeon]
MLKIEIQLINDILYQALKNSNKSKGSPDMPDGLSQGEQSKWLILYAEKYQRSIFLRDWLYGLFSNLYFSSIMSKESILVIYVSQMISKLYHKNFTSLDELYQWAKQAKVRSIYKDLTKNLLELVIKFNNSSTIQLRTKTIEEELHDYLN